MNHDLVVLNGRLVTADGVSDADLGITGGKVAALGERGSIRPEEARSRIDASGLHIFPGAVDPHCHFNDPGLTDREDFTTGSMSTAAGGVTTVVEHPLTLPNTVDEAAVRQKIDIAGRKSVVDFDVMGGLVPHNAEHMPRLYEMGVRSFKAFMPFASHYTRVNDGQLYRGMRIAAELGALVCVHAENHELIELLTAGLKREGRVDVRAYHSSRPPVCELEAIHTCLAFAEATRAVVHIVHMSLARGAEAIARAREEGVNATVETCPQYLVLTEEDLFRRGAVCLCSPPLRSRENVERLWEEVFAGRIDSVVSDHAPTSFGLANQTMIWDVIPGIRGIQTMLPALFTEGVHKRGLPLPRLAELISTNAAKRFDLYPKKGAVQAGSDADLILVDLEAEWTLREEDLFCMIPWSPFVGWAFKGRVETTLVRGAVVYERGEIKAEPGFGEWAGAGRNQP